MMCLGAGLFGFILLVTLCFLDLYVYFLHQIREVFCHFFQIGFQFLVHSLFSFWHPHDVNVSMLEVVPEAPYTIFIFFLRFYLFIFRQRGRRGERGREISVWLSLARPLPGTWPPTQACALTGNWTRNPLVCSQCSVHWATPARAIFIFFFLILFSLCCPHWLFFASLYFILLILFLASSTLLLFPCKFFFISISVSFVSDWIFYVVEVLIKLTEVPYNQCFELYM